MAAKAKSCSDHGDSVSLRWARVTERAALEDLQRRSSLHDPTYRRQLVAHPDAIALPVARIQSRLVRVAEQGGVVVGFAVLLESSGRACELDGLFVEPHHMRAGIGRRLIADAAQLARRRGAARIEVVATPRALAFYERVGFVLAGSARTRFGSAVRMALRVSD